MKHKIEGGIIQIQTEEILPIWEALNMDEESYSKYLRGLPFGRKYLIEREKLVAHISEKEKLIEEEVEARLEKEKQPERPIKVPKLSVPLEKSEKITAKDKEELSIEEGRFLEYISEHPGMFVTKIYKALGLSGYKGDKLKESLMERGLIVQEETRRGRMGRLAKVLTLTDKGASLLKKLAHIGKGGDIHRHFQIMIKEQAELYGWKAVVEERIPRTLESVDVGLRKDDMRVAIEISATSKPEQEIQNIRKCLDASYDYVISVFDDEKSLQSVKEEARKSFTAREKERIRFYLVGQVKEFLSSVAPLPIVSEKGIVSGQISREKQLLSTSEASEFLGISKNTLYEWIIQKKIPHIKVGRLVKFRREELDAWLKSRTREEKKDFM